MQVDIFSQFAVNETLATGGVWIPYMGTVEFKIARDSNHQFKKLAQKHYKQYGRLLDQGGDEAEVKGKEIAIDLVARTILVDWKGGDTLMYKGKPVGEFSVEAAKQLLAQEGFLKWVQEQSRDEKLFKEVQDAEEEKN